MHESESEKLYEVCSICYLFNECLRQDRNLSICPYGAYIMAGGDWQPTNQIICQVVISAMEDKGIGMLGVRWGCCQSDILKTHLILMFLCSNPSKPHHYLQHQGRTSKPHTPHPVRFDPWQTLHSQLLQCHQKHSSFWPYLITQIPRLGRAISCFHVSTLCAWKYLSLPPQFCLPS